MSYILSTCNYRLTIKVNLNVKQRQHLCVPPSMYIDINIDNWIHTRGTLVNTQTINHHIPLH